jgi:hypothetical protein
VALALDALRQDLASLAAIECDQGQEGYLWDSLLAGHRNPEIRELFDKRQIFFHEHQRVKERPNAIPRDLWHAALGLGLQLATQFEGFSLCANHGDYDEGSPGSRMETLVRRVEELARRIDAALLGLTARNAEVRQALDKVMQETIIS